MVCGGADVYHVILVSRHWNGSPPFAILPSCTFPCLRKRQIQIQIQKKGRKQGKKHAKWLPCNKSIFIFAPCSFLYALKIYQILYFVKYYKGTREQGNITRKLYVCSDLKVGLISYELERSHRCFRCQFYRL